MTGSPEPVFRVLNTLDLKYTAHVNEAGQVYAGFRIVLAPDTVIQFGMLRWGPTLVIRAHNVSRVDPLTEEILWDINLINMHWGLGRIYYAAERKAWEIATGVLLDGEDIEPVAVSAALESLCSVAGYLHSDTETRATSRDTLLQQLWFRYPPVSLSTYQIQAALDAAGLTFESRLDAQLLVQRFLDDSGDPFMVDIYPIESRFVFVRGRLDRMQLPSTEAALEALQHINTRLSLGTAVLDPESAQPLFLAGVPLALHSVTPALMRTLVDHVASATASIKRHLAVP
jgi:hypothetical protein